MHDLFYNFNIMQGEKAWSAYALSKQFRRYTKSSASVTPEILATAKPTKQNGSSMDSHYLIQLQFWLYVNWILHAEFR